MERKNAFKQTMPLSQQDLLQLSEESGVVGHATSDKPKLIGQETRRLHQVSEEPSVVGHATSDKLKLIGQEDGFTLIETILIVGIIAILIGLLLPAVQKAREAANAHKCALSLGRIGEAEKSFFQTHGTYSASFEALGLGTDFPPTPCMPGCPFWQNNGYFFEIVLGGSGQSFRAIGVPAVVGKTGSAKLVIDQTGQISTAPIKEAAQVHGQMFEAISNRAVDAFFRLILGRPATDLPAISRALESAGTLDTAFRHLDANGDGKVTFTEILNYSGTGRDVLSDFLQFLGRELELGAGGEDVQALPGVSLDMLKQRPPPAGQPALISVKAVDAFITIFGGFASASGRTQPSGGYRESY